jgi:hypothetical protein
MAPARQRDAGGSLCWAPMLNIIALRERQVTRRLRAARRLSAVATVSSAGQAVARV